MAQIVVRGIGDHTYAVLKNRAKRHGRSLEAELRDLDEAARHEDTKKVWAAIDRFHTRLKRSRRRFADSAPLVRKDRNR
jgi:plasmid stability protein